MGNEYKWAGIKKTKTLVCKAALEVPAEKSKPMPSPGCFRFDDGSTQNWTLDQLYDTYAPPDSTGAIPFVKVSTLSGFSLGNSQKLALAVETPKLLFDDPKAMAGTLKGVFLFLYSPDLSSDPNWQNIKGYSFDIYRTLTSADIKTKVLIEGKHLFHAQLYLRALDTSINEEKNFYEAYPDPNDPQKYFFFFHEIPLETPLEPLKWTLDNILPKPKFLITKIGIRLLMPALTGIGLLSEMYLQGKWLIGNVCPVKR